MNQKVSLVRPRRLPITGLVDRMEKAGLIVRQPGGEDRRLKFVRLTEKGGALLQKTYEAYATRLRDVVDPLSETEKNNLNLSLEKMRRVLRNTEKSG